MSQLNSLLNTDVFEAHLAKIPAGNIGVAVSGGGDSVALLILIVKWAKLNRRKINVATVNHQLRDESAGEALQVKKLCADLGVEHDILNWLDWNRQGNLQDAARYARKKLLREWAFAKDLVAIVLGHTLDDQAETVLLRLARGSGVDGLASIYPIEREDELYWFRPLLETKREDLRAYLRYNNISWVDDPSNEDNRFDRIKVRKAFQVLSEFGLTRERLALSAENMKRARQSLEAETLSLAKKSIIVKDIGSVVLDIDIYKTGSEECRFRLLAHCLKWVSGHKYPPRLKSLIALERRIGDKQIRSLHGCLLGGYSAQKIEITREVSAINPQNDIDQIFDGRWLLKYDSFCSTYHIRGLGEKGLRMCKTWRESGYSRRSLLASPSIWIKDELIAAPFAVRQPETTCQLVIGVHKFFTLIETH